MILAWLTLISTVLAAPLPVEEAVTAALSRSDALAHAGAEVEAAEGRRRATSFLQSDPTVAGSWAILGDAVNVQLMQPISLSGEGIAAHRAARAEVEAAEARARRTALTVAARTRRVWGRAVEARARRTLAALALEQAGALRVAAEQREATGEGTLLDVRLARLQEAEVHARWTAAVADEVHWVGVLGGLTGRAVQDIELPADPLAAAPERTVAGAERSDVVAARAVTAAAEAALARERAAVLPRVGLGGYYEEEDGARRAGPRLSLTIPLWNRNADGRAAARGALDAARATEVIAAAQATAEADAARWGRGVLAADDALAIDVPGEAAAAMRSVTAGFDGGELDLMTAALLRAEILRAQQAWLDGRRALAELRIDSALAEEDPGLLGEQPPVAR